MNLIARVDQGPNRRRILFVELIDKLNAVFDDFDACLAVKDLHFEFVVVAQGWEGIRAGPGEGEMLAKLFIFGNHLDQVPTELPILADVDLFNVVTLQATKDH
jgi:hypothetical protein